MATLVDDTPCLDPADVRRACEQQGLPVDWWGGPNQFAIPLNEGPGAGQLLLSRSGLKSLDLTTDHTVTFQDADGNSVPLQKVTILRARCVTPGADDDGNAAMLCEVVDRRHFLAKIPVTGDGKAYNVRSYDGTSYLAASCQDGVSTAWTWAQVFADLWGMLGVGGAAPSLPFTPDGTPENLTYWGRFALAAVCDLLDRLACALKYDPVGDTFAVVRLGNTSAAGATTAARTMNALSSDGDRLWDGQFNEPDRGRRPEQIRVLFPRRPQPQDGSSVYYHVDVTLPAVAGVKSGTFEILHDDLTADGSGTPTNTSALSSRATERANDWLRKRLNYERRLTVVYRDFGTSPPDLLSEVVGAVALGDRGDPMGTEVNARPDGKLERWRAYEQPLVLTQPSGGGGGGGGGMPGCGGCGFLAGATSNDCWQVKVSLPVGNMAGIDSSQTLTLQWDGSGWTSTAKFNTCLQSGYLKLDVEPDGSNPRLRILGILSGGADYHLVLSCCSGPGMTLYFCGGNTGTDVLCCAQEVFTASGGTGGPAFNLFTLVVQWVPCVQSCQNTGTCWDNSVATAVTGTITEASVTPGGGNVGPTPFSQGTTGGGCAGGFSTSGGTLALYFFLPAGEAVGCYSGPNYGWGLLCGELGVSGWQLGYHGVSILASSAVYGTGGVTLVFNAYWDGTSLHPGNPGDTITISLNCNYGGPDTSTPAYGPLPPGCSSSGGSSPMMAPAAPRKVDAAGWLAPKPCRHRGDPTGEVRTCTACSGKKDVPVLSCAVHGTCFEGNYTPDGWPRPQACDLCTDRVIPGPDRATTLALPSQAGDAFNAGLIRYRGRLLLAYRDAWGNSRVRIAELGDDLSVGRVVTLAVDHARCRQGQDDPRLFVFRDRLHVSFVGVEAVDGRVITHQMYARLGDGLEVEEVFAPQYAGRTYPYEKNWVFFEHAGELYCVYAVAPDHIILKVDGDTATLAHSTPNPFPWSGGHYRGGASPVLVGDRYYHWFHGRLGDGGRGNYSAGVYTFEAAPPFAIRALTPRPVLWPNPRDRDKRRVGEPAVVFPCGAVLERPTIPAPRRIIVRPRADIAALDPGEPFTIISLYDYGGTPPDIPAKPNLKNVLRLRFQDFDPDRRAYSPSETYQGTPVADQWMKPEHGKAIWAFLRDHPAPVVVIHCNMAQSRSPAVAMAIADELGLPRGVIDWVGAETGRSDPTQEVNNLHVYRTTRAATPGPRWLVSYGVEDHRVDVGEWDAAAVEEMLRKSARADL